MENTKQERIPNKKLPYILAIVISLTVVITLTIVLISLSLNNRALKEQQASIIEEYSNIAKMHNNLTDEDYASVYFDGNTIYIPKDNLVIEYGGD